MTPSDTTLHLWFKPYGNVLNETDISFVDRYVRRFYPRAITNVSKELRKLVSNVTRMFDTPSFEYQLRHYTVCATKRYVIEESLRDTTSPDSLSIGIQCTTAEERKLFTESFSQEDGCTTKLPPVTNVIAYLEDSMRVDAHKWENAKLHNGKEAIAVMQEIITFLKNIQSTVRVYDFSFTETEQGTVLSLALVAPNLVAYYARIDWTIV